MDSYLLPSLASATGMMIVAIVAVVYWRQRTHVQARWFWAGAGLWTIAVVLKVVCAGLVNAAVIGFLKEQLSYVLFVVGGGLFVGIQSSLFEIGLTFLAVLIWPQLGRDPRRAIGIGIGAGAFEAFLMGLALLIGVLVAVGRTAAGSDNAWSDVEAAARITPLFWLRFPVERIMTILCHASCRALVLLGTTKKRPMAVLWGFLIFALLDAVAGGVQISGRLGSFSAWWCVLANLPFALVSVFILRWCETRWGKREDDEAGSVSATYPAAPADMEEPQADRF